MDDHDLADFEAATHPARWRLVSPSSWLRLVPPIALPLALLLSSALAMVASIRGMAALTQRPAVHQGDLTTFLVWLALTTLAAVALGVLGVRSYRRISRGDGRRDADDQPYYDPATGLPTNRLFESLVEQTLSRAARAERLVAVLLLDLERIKIITARKGAVSGDSALRVMAARVKGCLRGNPTVARIAGDEFAVLVEGPSSREEVSRLAEKIKHTVNLPLTLNGEEILLNTSIGVAFHRTDGSSAQELLAHAEAAMATAKSRDHALQQESTPHAQPLTDHDPVQAVRASD